MTFTGNEKRILGLTSAAHFLTHLYELTFPALALTVRDDLGWSLSQVLRLSFGMYLLFGLGSLPMGILTDHWKARWVLVFSMFGAGIGCLLVARAETQTQFILALALVGLCISAYHPAGMSLLSRAVRQRGRALGLNGVFGNLGSATAPFIAGILAYELGWRAAYVALGGLGFVAALGGLLLRVEEPERITSGPGSIRAERGVMGAFAILCVAMMLAGLAYRGVSLVLPATFETQTTFLDSVLERLRFTQLQGVQNLAATLIASGVYAMGMAGQVLGGHLADRKDLRKLYLLFHGVSLPFVIAMAFVDEGLLVIVAGVYVFFALGMQPIENSLVARFTPERWRSTSYGVKFILNFGVGSLGVYGVAALRPEESFTPVYLAVAAMVFLVCLTSAVLLLRTPGMVVRNEEVAAVLS
jgi:MFS family permease